MKINNYKNLEESIKYLNWKKDIQKERFFASAQEFYITFQPRNIVNEFFKTIPYSFKDKITGAVLGISSGIIIQKFIKRIQTSLPKKIVGRLVQLGVTGIVAKNSNTIKAIAFAIAKNIFKKKTSNLYMYR